MTDTTARVSVLTGSQLVLLRRRLEEERDRLTVKLRPEVTAGGGSSGLLDRPLMNDPEDFGEMAQDIMIEDTEQALSANDEAMLRQIEHALERMDAGTYGRSEISDEPIPYDRLDALPWATTIVGES